MRTIGGKPQPRRRSARWQVKKHDDTVIERWARACSREHGDCRGCEFMENCQDLADRLIGCMGVPLTGQYKQHTTLHSGAPQDLRPPPLIVLHAGILFASKLPC